MLMINPTSSRLVMSILSPSCMAAAQRITSASTTRHQSATTTSQVSPTAKKGLGGSASHEDKTMVDEWLIQKLKSPGLLLKASGLIGGQWHGAADGATYDLKNPATGKLIARMPLMKGGETRAAIAAADSVLPKWKELTSKARSVILRRWHDLILAHQEDIAVLMTVECGKPLAESRAEVASGVASVEWFAEECRRTTGDIIETVDKGRRMVVLKQPIGVVAAITPWNFPMSMVTRKVAPALAAGCTVVLKPSELTPLTAIALSSLAMEAGIPSGALNLVMGDAPAIGAEMISNGTVRKIGFTGSTAVGKLLMAGAAKTVKRVSLELGGNAPVIVFQDADLDLAAKGAVLSGLRNAGQTCICANRVLVHSSVHDEFVVKVKDIVSMIKLGDGLEGATTMGPLISKAAVDKVAAHVQDAVSKGGRIVVGGKAVKELLTPLPQPLDSGAFFEPTVIEGATIEMRCFSEETFGPLLPIFKFESEEEAVMLANNTEYGLAAYYYTKDLARAWRVAEALEFGMVGLNEVAITSEAAPFGGIKQSGLGREQSKYGLQEFQDIKYVCMGLGGR